LVDNFSNQKQIKLKVKSLPGSSKLTGKTNEFEVINNHNFNSNEHIDLSKINYEDQTLNFNKILQKLEQKTEIFNDYITEYIKQGFKVNKLDTLLKQGIDYEISFAGIGGAKIDIESEEFKAFLNDIKINKKSKLKITIYALAQSTQAINSISYYLINEN
jgi:hypothetical protein